ncbi:MAG: hypothetical protein ACFFHV_05050 [Promethearchaeota archaeon]
MEYTKEIRSVCPLCGEHIKFYIDEKLIKETHKLPAAVTFEHCNRILIIYLDAQLQVRGIDSAFKVNSDNNYSENSIDGSLLTEVISRDFIHNKTIEERILYRVNSHRDAINRQAIPDIFEKQLLNILYNQKELSLFDLLQEALILEKALNIKVNYSLIENALKKYVDQNLITKRILEFREDF